jgi:SAM-dependent MidA family methyltransferase
LGQNRVMSLPTPVPEALAVSQKLTQQIAHVIDAAGGWIGFDRWMDLALYAPGYGYYSGPAPKLGPQGDFVTAPELSPLFAQMLAHQLAHWFEHVPAHIVECGAGTGRLAADLCAALADRGVRVARYDILELSAPLRARQKATLAERAPEFLPTVRWLDTLPERIEGVVLGNELLDALPVRVWQHEAEVWSEWGVTVDAARQFAWAARPAGPDLVAAIREVMPPGPPPWGAARVYRSEWAPQVDAWVRSVAARLHQGVLLLIDYGFPAHEYYHPQRSEGTLVAHYQHRLHHDLLRWPGLQDLTAHVNFSAVARAAQSCGLALLGFTSQARFLLNCGVLDVLARHMPQGVQSRLDARAMAAAQTLLSEAEMGELFKVMALGRGVPEGGLGFTRGDRRGAL